MLRSRPNALTALSGSSSFVQRLVALLLTTALAACPTTPESNGPDGDTAITDVPESDAGAEVTAELPPTGCTFAADCEAEWAGQIGDCQEAACNEGKCVLVDANEGGACSDAVNSGPCASSEAVCKAGTCVPIDSTGAQLCDDGNDCTTDACDPNSGCVHTFNQKPCDDGTICTTSDRCFMGACTGDALSCDDNNACTDDTCDPVAGCSNTPNTETCTDGDACTNGDLCAAGECIPGPPLVCDDGEVCTEEFCDSDEGCVVTILDGPCDDGDACTENTTCMAGVCTGTLLTCDDNNVCTTDKCDVATGCSYTFNFSPCSDGESCTLADTCSEGVCIPGPIDPLCCDEDDECDDGDACTNDSCTNNYCAFVPLDCDDGFGCTTDTCVEGVCQNDAVGPQSSGPVVSDDFESGLGFWKATTTNPEVNWQIDSSESVSGSSAAYMGNPATYTYEYGQSLVTLARTVTLPVANAITLSFQLKMDVDETLTCNYDKLELLVEGQLQFPQMCDDVEDWTLQTYDLTGFSGQVVTIEFVFDTVDSIANSGMGAWIDDFEILVEGPSDCCLEATDCDAGDGAGCLAVTCHPTGFTCMVLPQSLACDDGDACTLDLCEADGSCSTAPNPACCSDASTCPAHPTKPCAVPVCGGADGEMMCGFDESACCESDEACPVDPTRPCEVGVCGGDGACSVDDSACCVDAASCPSNPAAPCEQPTCQVDGSCGLDDSACCTEASQCPTNPDAACQTPICDASGTCGLDPSTCCASDDDCDDDPVDVCKKGVCGGDGLCVLDESLCCAESSDCPEAPEGPCAVPTCSVDGECTYDTSACP